MSVTCGHCGRTYDDPSDEVNAAALTGHIQSEHTTWTATCGLCGESFTDRTEDGANGQMNTHKSMRHQEDGGPSGGLFGGGYSGPGGSGSSGGGQDRRARRNDPFKGTGVRTHKW